MSAGDAQCVDQETADSHQSNRAYQLLSVKALVKNCSAMTSHQRGDVTVLHRRRQGSDGILKWHPLATNSVRRQHWRMFNGTRSSGEPPPRARFSVMRKHGSTVDSFVGSIRKPYISRDSSTVQAVTADHPVNAPGPSAKPAERQNPRLYPLALKQNAGQRPRVSRRRVLKSRKIVREEHP
ncbi:hypothetical protein HRR80_000651 [Exophiala dermatitidis]|uniref:Uncharacterized protein n=1 Tax=Exophiala dermatitidis TaxID=5970 RepID=A0AAN6F294_EXODE|nr:hypothetical protein HRR80_000651 [Exophiala dermatitidis]